MKTGILLTLALSCAAFGAKNNGIEIPLGLEHYGKPAKGRLLWVGCWGVRDGGAILGRAHLVHHDIVFDFVLESGRRHYMTCDRNGKCGRDGEIKACFQSLGDAVNFSNKKYGWQ